MCDATGHTGVWYCMVKQTSNEISYSKLSIIVNDTEVHDYWDPHGILKCAIYQELLWDAFTLKPFQITDLIPKIVNQKKIFVIISHLK